LERGTTTQRHGYSGTPTTHPGLIRVADPTRELPGGTQIPPAYVAGPYRWLRDWMRRYAPHVCVILSPHPNLAHYEVMRRIFMAGGEGRIGPWYRELPRHNIRHLDDWIRLTTQQEVVMRERMAAEHAASGIRYQLLLGGKGHRSDPARIICSSGSRRHQTLGEQQERPPLTCPGAHGRRSTTGGTHGSCIQTRGSRNHHI